MKKKITLLITGCISLVLFGFVANKTMLQEPWPVPDSYKNKANPVAKTDADALQTGKELYAQHCQSCHGKKGKGDGSKASQLDTDPGDFTTAKFQAQTDGAIFYKTFEGRKDMPSYKKKIPAANDIWAVVNYMRTLK